ncbi:hypothetical protein [Viridibacillus arvi]|uniref:hypothetical protein n=1 Tax=Viridibacillus arvi TaxID=263475 RepID=UPI0034CD283A
MKRNTIIETASKNYQCLKNKESWECYANEHNLPSYEKMKKLFNGWKDFKRAVYLMIAKKYIEFFFTPKYWDAKAKSNDLPEAKQYRALFGDWKEALKVVHEGLDEVEIKKLFLISIAKKYKEHFTTQKEWDDFANKNELPISATYKNHFVSWNKVVEIVTGKEILEQRFTKETLLNTLSEHTDYLITQETWKMYAQENHLPSINTIVKHFGSFNEAKRKLSVKKIQKRVFTKDELWEVAKEHKEMFHLSLWNFYASTKSLPTETAFINHFGRFKAVQELLGVEEGKYSNKTRDLMNAAIKQKEAVLRELIQKNEKVVEQIYKYWHLFDSKKTWGEFAATGFPSYNELLSVFSSKRQLKQVLFFYIALINKEHFNNMEWNDFAEENNLPSKTNYYNLFSSWEWIQLMVWEDAKESKRSYLLRIANKHIEHFTTYSNWKDYASNHTLPSASQFEFYFGSWNQVKKALGLKLNRNNA